MPKIIKILKYGIDSGTFLIVALMPLYLIRLKISWIPTNVLELMICIVFGLWLFSRLFLDRSGSISWRGGLGKLKKLRLFFRQSPDLKSWLYPILLILLGVSFSALLATDFQASTGIWKGWFLAPLLFLIVLIDTVKSESQIKNILKALTLSGAIVSLISLFYWFNGYVTYDSRLAGFYLSANHLAMYLAPILLLSIYLYKSLSNNILKCLLVIAQLMMLGSLYLTLSYGTWLAIAGALAFFSIVFSRSKKLQWRFVFYSFLVVLTIIVLLLSSQISSRKFHDMLIAPRSNSSVLSRTMIWQSAVVIIKDHPLIGIGPGQFQREYLEYQNLFDPYLEWAVPQPHNLYLAFWLQAGLLGLIGFVWLLISFFKAGFKRLNFLSITLMSAMTYTLLHGVIDTPYWKNDLAIIFWLIIGLMIINLKKTSDL